MSKWKLSAVSAIIGACIAAMVAAMPLNRAVAQAPAVPLNQAAARAPALDCRKNPNMLVHPLFADHMVLQRDAADAIWGCTRPGAQVRVSIAGVTVSAVATATGLWQATLRPMPAGGPLSMSIVSPTGTRAINDVMIGDVWLCSGQSNMGLSVLRAMDAAAEVADSDRWHLRLFRLSQFIGPTTANGLPDGNPQWMVSGPGNVRSFSAVCYFFGRDLLDRSGGIPQGLIQAAYGGTSIDWWMSAAALADDPDFAAEVARLRDGTFIPGPGEFFPTSLFNGMIAPLMPFSLRGIAWYQGEGDAGNPSQYERLLPKLIGDWRETFGLAAGDPFLVVQLPRYGAPQTYPVETSGWALLREAQLHAAQSVPDTWLAVTFDTGDADNVHPLDKQDVATRLAAIDLNLTTATPGEGPLYRRAVLEGSSIRIAFDNASIGLMVGRKEPLQPVVRVSDSQLTGFAIAGADRQFVWANARIEGPTVVVSSPSVPNPVAVRYGWASNPRANLYSLVGIPASPFRTDDW